VSLLWLPAALFVVAGAGFAVALLAALVYATATFGIWWVDRREAGVFAHRTPAETLEVYRTFLDELLAAAFFFFLHPFGSIDPLPPRTRELYGRRPILLVHGYAQARSNFWILALRLMARGHGPLYEVNLRPATSGLLVLADVLSARMDDVIRATNARDVDVVAHSMGGIVTRLAEAGRSGRRVRRLVTLGTPHAGTRVAELALFRSGMDLRPGSEALARMPEPPPGLVVAISSHHDNVVVPPESGRIGDGGRDIIVGGVGHFSLLVDAGVAEEVSKALGEDVMTADRVLPREAVAVRV
jgi:hypothetical protein